MKKILFSVVALSILGASTYALFPDTPGFPRIPIGDGTIGKIFTQILGTSTLENYSADGTVQNTHTLSGVSGSGYLKKDTNCTTGQKYIGINADGERLCGITTTLLTDYGTIESQGCPADYYRADETSGKTATGNLLKAGDIVKTAPGCPMMIVFADYSLLRLDGDTTVSLDLGSFADGTTIASAIVANGSLWGRILTETGSYNVGTDVIVVGVRGTSIHVQKPSLPPTITLLSGTGWEINQNPGLTEINIVHSTNTPIVGTGVCMDMTGALSFPVNIGTKMTAPSAGSVNCQSLLSMALPVSSPISNYSTNSGVARYTIEDIRYLQDILSGSITPSARLRILDEIGATNPVSPAERDTICPDSSGAVMTFWSSLIGTKYDICRESNLLAYANYQSGVLYTNSVNINPVTNDTISPNRPRLTYSGSTIAGFLGGDWSLQIEYELSSTGSLQSLVGLYNGGTNTLRLFINTSGYFQIVGGPINHTGAISLGAHSLKISRTAYKYNIYDNGSGIILNTLITPPIDTIHLGRSNLGSNPWEGTIKELRIRN